MNDSKFALLLVLVLVLVLEKQEIMDKETDDA